MTDTNSPRTAMSATSSSVLYPANPCQTFYETKDGMLHQCHLGAGHQGQHSAYLPDDSNLLWSAS